MKKKFYLFIPMLCIHLCSQSQSLPNIIPKPQQMQLQNGTFTIDANTSIYTNSTGKASLQTVSFLKDYVKKITGISLKTKSKNNKRISFLIQNIKDIGDEGYLLSVQTTQIIIRAKTPKGLFYALQSLLQCLPAIRTNDTPIIPCMEIKDEPRFAWRGMMLDVSRHFFAPEFIKEFIDLLATYKMNTFHWHLVDGAGWRIEIIKYPKLTQQAAWRVSDWGKTWNWGNLVGNNDRNKSTYGGFYSQEQIKEIVSYAKARNITIVPEIEMPGHSEIVMAAYPELSCNSKYNFKTNGNFNIAKSEGNYCAGNDSAFMFLQNVLEEVLSLFPSTYIHIGGDEVDKSSWKQCAKCQKRIRTEKLNDENELQSYFIKRIEKYLLSKKRKLIGWDEILEGGLAPSATVMSWRGEDGGIQAAKMKHNVVMSPGFPCYFDHYQSNTSTEPLAIGGLNTLKNVYEYEPIPKELKPQEATYVLGAQANLWTEYINTWEHAEYMILPRMPALAEVLWSAKEKRNYDDFFQRLQNHFITFEQRGIHHRNKGNFDASIKSFVVDKKISIVLETENPDAIIYYTTDGKEPNAQSNKYNQPFEIATACTVKVAVGFNDKIMSTKTTEQSFVFHKATDKGVKYDSSYNSQYPASGQNALTDGIRGTYNILKNWHGFLKNDMVASIYFDNPITASNISLGCMQSYGYWIFYPQWIKFESSIDGINFKEIQTLQNTISPSEKEMQIKDFAIKFEEQKIKAIRISAKNIAKCPIGHPGENKDAFIFVDEVIVY